MPKLDKIDTSYAPLANLIQEISHFLVFNMVLAAILKNRLLEYFPATFGRCMGAYFTGVASHTKPGHLIELKYVPILKMYRALDKNDSFLIV